MTTLLALVLVSSGPARPPLVVIDPGHGGELAGAVGVCGVSEKDVTLAISKELAALLEATGRVNAILTRTEDRDLDLEARPALANERGADLFVSVHANASTRAESHGVETFFLSRGAASRRVRDLARRENEGAHIELPAPRDPLEGILDQLRLSAAHEESQRFAMRVQRTLTDRLRASARGVLQAPFIVLLGAQMPAALVEVGFLTHPDECEQLATVEHQRTVARALATAIFAHLKVEARALAHNR